MDTNIIVALIALLGSLVTNAVTIYINKKKDKKIKVQQTEIARQQGEIDKLAAAPKEIAVLLTGLYGFRVGEARTTVDIDLDGTAKVTTSRLAVEAVGSVIGQFPVTARIASSGQIDAPRLTSSFVRGKSVRLVPLASGANEWTYNLIVDGDLHPGDGPLDATICYTQTGTYCMTEESANATYSKMAHHLEWYTHEIVVPTGKLELEIKLPLGYDVDQFYVAVLIGKSETFHQKELQRIRQNNNLSTTKNSARLCVSDPILGLRYSIRWQPLPKDRYELLKKKGAVA